MIAQRGAFIGGAEKPALLQDRHDLRHEHIEHRGQQRWHQVEAVGELGQREAGDEHSFEQVGDLLFAAVNVARRLKVDPELSLRSSTGRFRGRLEVAEEMARTAGLSWNDLDIDQPLEFYARARMTEDQ